MKKPFLFSVIVIGFSSILTQIIFLRESISGFYGNELLLGVVLGNWLLLTGIGSYLGRFSKGRLELFIITEILLAIIVIPSIFLIGIIRNFIATPGELLPLNLVFFYSLLILSPFCLLSGFQFTLASKIFSREKKDKAYEASRVYVLDSIGDLLGGFFFSYFLVFFFDSFQSISLIIFLNLFSGFLLSKNLRRGREFKALISFLAIFFFILLSQSNLSLISTEIQFSPQRVLAQENSIYGNLVVTQRESQLNFYENSFPLFSTGNNFSNEEKIHYAMLQNPSAEKVLLISGGISGTLNEILKYPEIERIDYVELDPKIIELGRKFLSENLKSERVRVHNIDGRLWVKKSKEKYDSVIIDLPDPESIQVNRFYTLEFFREVKGILNKDGILALSLSGGENYLSEEEKDLNSAIYKTLKRVFNNVMIIPGDTNFFISSDGNLSYNYGKRLEDSKIKTEFIQYYLPGKITEDRIDYILSVVKGREDVRVNEDFKPVSHYYYLKYYLSLFNLDFTFTLVIILLILILTFYLTKFKPLPLSIFVVGFSGMALEFILILGFQILYGYVYEKIGVIITAFMLGIFLSSYYVTKKIRSRGFSTADITRFQFLLSLYPLILSLILLGISRISEASIIFLSVEILFPVLTSILGALVGAIFPLAVKIYFGKKKDIAKTISLLYSIDLIGSCLGAYTGSVILIPSLGVWDSCIFLFFLNIIITFYLWLRG